MVLYAYSVFIVFLLHRESPDLILVDEPLILRCFCHINTLSTMAQPTVIS
jgi:hypothetical protein